ncbi:BA14K family protein [Agrobacterium tumefaciens]|uniref:BA14K family protein n=1 Tax=Agrobacterium tumefaciens TaxID=358 RepID=UPI001572A3E7|nr:BA14K family protein [Agrobacterium tumefaciens]WCJ61518.1 BA14K family protein [Agrobacterium tumefaciens]
MLRMPKTISALALGVAISTAATVPAHALSLIQPAYQQQEQADDTNGRGNSASAFAAGKGEEATANGYALSQTEINHVKWCAARYASYHPTDNSYMAAAGAREQCRSPH